MALSKADNEASLADYYAELTEEEAKAIISVVEDADGRRQEVKTARKALGIGG